MDIPIDIPPGINSDDTTFAATPAWVDVCNMRFRLKRPQTIKGWESLTLTLLAGVCRAVFPWTDNNSATLNIAFGTHSNLQVYRGGALPDITPYGPPTLLAAGPLSVSNTSAVVTVSHPAHGLPNATPIIVANAVAIGGITPNGGPFAITVIDADRYSYVFTSPATSTVAGAGGSNIVVTPQTLLPAGLVDGTGQSGYGTGTYGGGTYGTISTADYFPRTWSLAAWGQKLLASPRNGGLYEWSNDTAVRAVALPTAPTRITQMLVARQRQVFALGCTQENGAWNPLCVRHSGIGDETQWATDATSSSTAREYILPGGGRIVGGKFIGRYLLIWTTQALFLGTYVGQINQVWRFDEISSKCGLIGPNAVTTLDTTAFWISPDRQFHAYTLGGRVMPMACPIREDFDNNLTPAQTDKIVASTIAEYSEVRWDYPDNREGYEVSRYIAVAVDGLDVGSWYRGRPLNGVNPARTAFCDAGPATYPVGITFGGNIYWHERGHSADGGALPWLIKTADFYLDPNIAMLIREMWPDIADDQQGAVMVAIAMRMYPKISAEWPVTDYGPFVVAPGQSLLDLGKASGRICNLTYSGSTAPSYARIGKPVFDAKPRGRRG